MNIEDDTVEIVFSPLAPIDAESQADTQSDKVSSDISENNNNYSNNSNKSNNPKQVSSGKPTVAEIILNFFNSIVSSGTRLFNSFRRKFQVVEQTDIE